MEFSLGKMFWKAWLWFFDVFVRLFSILVFVVFALIILQINPDFKDLVTLFVSLSVVLSVAGFARVFPIWAQAVYLLAYFKFSYWLILKLLALGMVDYNFAWTLPKWINDVIGVSVTGMFADFVFWSGFVLIVLTLIDRLEREFLVFLAGKMKIDWARELIEERMEKLSKSQKAEEGIIEAGKKKEVKDNEISSPSPSKERIVLRPKFFKDRLWYQWIMFLSMVFPVLMLSFVFGGISDVVAEGPSNPLYFIFGGAVLLIFLICLPFFLWEATTRIVLEKDKIVIKTFFFQRTEIYYSDVKNVDVRRNEGLKIYYEKQTKKGKISKVARFFPWAFTTEKLLKELKSRLENVDIDEDFIINSTKTIRAARGLATVLTVLITVGLFTGFVYYIINQATNRPKFSDDDCANQLEFWINDEPKTGILETREGFIPELSIKAPFYLFIDAEKSAPECNKNISLVIYNASGYIVFQRGGLVPPESGIVNYRWEALFKERGDYLLKLNYGNILAEKIYFSVK